MSSVPLQEALLTTRERNTKKDVQQQHDYYYYNNNKNKNNKNHRDVSVSVAVPPPHHELSLRQFSFNTFSESSSSTSSSIFSYMIFLMSLLLVWQIYLLLPRGCRKQYCFANRKRYSRRIDPHMPPAGYWLPVHSLSSQQQQQQEQQQQHSSSTLGIPTMSIEATTGNHRDNHPNHHNNFNITTTPLSRTTTDEWTSATTLSSPSIITRGNTTSSYPNNNNNNNNYGPPLAPSELRRRSVSTPPSPEHPALKRIPPNKVIAETMARLQGLRGIRLVAHGVHCDPKRVWIRLQDHSHEDDHVHEDDHHHHQGREEQPCLTWQTEFPRRIPNQQPQDGVTTTTTTTIVLMRGSLHKILLKHILYIDVGKKTQALRLTPTTVPDTTCWSLLTQNGSLDLQASSSLERDALVSCFSMILDDIHEEDWRALYEASPEPSLTQVSTAPTLTTMGNTYPQHRHQQQ